MTRLTIEYLDISLPKPDPRNPRQHSKQQIAQIAKSITAFGYNAPILIDKNNYVIAGHGRLLACKKLGYSEIPVIRLEHLSPAQVKAYMIADNRLTDTSEWNDQLLAETFKELSALELEFSLEDTGFTMGEIDLRIESLSAPEDMPDNADLLPEVSTVPVSKEGDLWQLGHHRLFCGSALEESSYTTLLAGKRASVIFTDPPYNVPIDGHVSGLGATRHREFAMAAGEMTKPEFASFLYQTCSLMALNSVDGAIHFICMDWRHTGELVDAGLKAYNELKNICIWVKDNGGMGSLYRSQHEFILVFKHGKAPHQNHVQLGQYGRYRTNVWKYPCANSFSKQSDEGKLLAMHPTVKPVVLVADALLDCSSRGDIVLDPFLGSGTTLIAAEKIGRICYSMEIDPLYVDTAIRRWQQWTGDKAVHVASGKRFDDLAVESEVARGG